MRSVTPAWTLINVQACCGEKNYMVFCYIAFFRIMLHFFVLSSFTYITSKAQNYNRGRNQCTKMLRIRFCCVFKLAVHCSVLIYLVQVLKKQISVVCHHFSWTFRIQTPFVSVCGSVHCHVRNNELAVRQVMCEVGHTLSRAAITVMRPRAHSK